MKISRAWLQTYFDTPLPEAKVIEDALTFHSFEIEESVPLPSDTMIDVKVLPNRAADCLSHLGIAKELSAILQIPLKNDPLRTTLPPYPVSKKLSVSVDDPMLCDRYIGAVVEGVKVGPSPAWLKTALEAVGARSINNVVDATNYVMLNIGQPLHAFDAEKLSRKNDTWNIRVRSANEGEHITTLSNEARELTSETLVITDGNERTLLGIAGVKGGKAAEITEDTTTIILESAHFNYASVRKTAQRLKLFTDASQRFQNNPSPKLAEYGMHEVITLILDIAGGTLEGVVDTNPGIPSSKAVSVSLSQVSSVLGTPIGEAVAEDAFKRLTLPFEKNGEVFTVTPPFERTDIQIPEDLIEEVGRIYGYEHVTPTPLPHTNLPIEINTRWYYSEKIRHILTELGFSEVMTYAFQDVGEVEVANPLASDKAFLRRDISTSLGFALVTNDRTKDLLGLPDVRLFEIGSVFENEKEFFSVAIGIKNSAKPKEGKKLYQDVRSQFEVSFVKEVEYADGGLFEFPLENYFTETPTSYESVDVWYGTKYRPISQYPFILRDIAVWVPESVSSEEVETIIRAQAGTLLVRITLFDEFKKEGKTSYAFRLVFQSNERTLSDEEISKIMTGVTNTLNGQEGWTVR